MDSIQEALCMHTNVLSGPQKCKSGHFRLRRLGTGRVLLLLLLPHRICSNSLKDVSVDTQGL